MDKKTLEKNLANIERELLALQTAHELGLGSINYWEYNDIGYALYEGTICYIKVHVKDGENINTIINFYTDTSVAFMPTILQSKVYLDRYLLWAVSFSPEEVPSFAFKLVSTSQLEYEQLSTPEEAEEWLVEY